MGGGSPSMKPGLASLAPAGVAAAGVGVAEAAGVAATVVVAADMAAAAVAEVAGPAVVTVDIDRERETTSTIAASPSLHDRLAAIRVSKAVNYPSVLLLAAASGRRTASMVLR